VIIKQQMSSFGLSQVSALLITKGQRWGQAVMYGNGDGNGSNLCGDGWGWGHGLAVGWGWIPSLRGQMGMGINYHPRAAL